MQMIPIDDLDLPELAIFQSSSEVALKRYFEPKEGIFIAESANAILRALAAGYEPLSFLCQEDLLDKDAKAVLAAIAQRESQIPVYLGSHQLLCQITGFHLTKGMLCAMRRKHLPTLEELLSGAHRIAILEDVENPTNIGAIVRSAAALSMDAILMTADCADPLYRRAIRVSTGTIFQIPWTILHKGKESGMREEDLRALKERGFALAAMALGEETISIADPRLHREQRIAVIMGNEWSGVSKTTLEVCDYCVKIPMREGVDSLNVAAASAVAFWQLTCKD